MIKPTPPTPRPSEDEVLRRMLTSKPAPRKSKQAAKKKPKPAKSVA